MKNKQWYAAVALVTLMSLSGSASAADMHKGGDAHHHMKHMKQMCDSADFKKDKATFEKMHTLHEKLHAVLVAKTFDKKAFLSLSNQMEQLRSQMARHHAEAFASIAAKLSPEEREKMIGRFHDHEHGEGGWQHHGGWSHGARLNNNATHDWTPPSDR